MSYILESYDNNLKKIIDTGFYLNDRTGVGCYVKPGLTTEVDISERVPVPTRRKTAWKSMLKEYLWFLTGSDKISDLQNMGSKVWDSWIDDNFTDKHNFDNTSIGYGYGPNLINYGAELNQSGGFNQIDFVINELKSNIASRRVLFSFWRPDKMDEVKLPPCHVIYQFIAEPDASGELNNLSCCVYQRSSDYFVGVGSTNLQGAAFYTYMIAQQVGMKPKTLYHMSGNAHVYSNHVEQVKEYLQRDIVNSPILILNKKNSIYDYTADDFELIDYNPLEKINISVAV